MQFLKLPRALLAYLGYGYAGKTVKPKNPRRVEGGKKAAETRKRNREAREFAVVTESRRILEEAGR